MNANTTHSLSNVLWQRNIEYCSSERGINSVNFLPNRIYHDFLRRSLFQNRSFMYFTCCIFGLQFLLIFRKGVLGSKFMDFWPTARNLFCHKYRLYKITELILKDGDSLFVEKKCLRSTLILPKYWNRNDTCVSH